MRGEVGKAGEFIGRRRSVAAFLISREGDDDDGEQLAVSWGRRRAGEEGN